MATYDGDEKDSTGREDGDDGEENGGSKLLNKHLLTNHSQFIPNVNVLAAKLSPFSVPYVPNKQNPPH
jgi:hypothetical protein